MIKNVKVISYGGIEFDEEVYHTVNVNCELDGIPNFDVTFGSTALKSALVDAMDKIGEYRDFDTELATIIYDGLYGYVRTDLLDTMDDEEVAKFIEDNFD